MFGLKLILNSETQFCCSGSVALVLLLRSGRLCGPAVSPVEPAQLPAESGPGFHGYICFGSFPLFCLCVAAASGSEPEDQGLWRFWPISILLLLWVGVVLLVPGQMAAAVLHGWLWPS